MCGRYTVTSPAEALIDELGLDAVDPGYTPRYNLAPTQPAPVVTGWEPRRLALVRWGLIPSWSRDGARGKLLINARAETALQKPSFRDAFEKRRCMVVADGFYEWRGRGASKVPIYFRLRSRRPFAFAGIWDGWLTDAGELARSCAVLTTAPNDLVAPIHDRMPVMLDADARQRWLASDDLEELRALCRPFPAAHMECFAVSARVGSPKLDEPGCIEPAAPRGTLPLFPGP
jgi:putative SOS response-associated peptidase YedK